jgi:lambda family phage portal protein
MGLWSRLFRRDRQAVRMRAYEAAKTNRLNAKHWKDANDNSVNANLVGKLEKLRSRATYEARHNPFVEGVIHSHACDVVGDQGPILQVQSKDETYNDALEQLWAEWWSMPDITGELSGVEVMRLLLRQEWTCGEFLIQKVTDDDVKGPVKLRLNLVHPRRLDTPFDKVASDTITMGIERTPEGKPLTYFINPPSDSGLMVAIGEVEPIPADQIIHGFKREEPGQARGVPRLTSVLPVVADMRDYDAQVLDAARQAADQAVLLHTDHPDSKFLDVNETTDIERRVITTLPPGWQATQLKPEQPSTKYAEYRKERLRELGRPANMPLMMVVLDSSGHNYSSARFDGQLYQRGIRSEQRWYERRVLNELVDEVAREGGLAQRLPKLPGDVKYVWTWPVPPHVDPVKERNAELIGLKAATLPFKEALAAHGLNEDQVIASWKRTDEKFRNAGLPSIFEILSWASMPPPESEKNETKGKASDDDRAAIRFPGSAAS